MPRVRCEPGAGVDADRWTLHLDDGRVYRIHNRAKTRGRWHAVESEHATRRIFVAPDGERLIYVFRAGDNRIMTANAHELARQVAAAIARKTPASRASIEWSGDKLYFTTHEGRVYRVHDGWYKNKRHVNVKPGMGFPPSRWFVPADKTDWIRVFHFTNHDEREVSVAALEQQFLRTHFLANKHQPASHASDWKQHLKAEQLR